MHYPYLYQNGNKKIKIRKKEFDFKIFKKQKKF